MNGIAGYQTTVRMTDFEVNQTVKFGFSKQMMVAGCERVDDGGKKGNSLRRRDVRGA